MENVKEPNEFSIRGTVKNLDGEIIFELNGSSN